MEVLGSLQGSGESKASSDGAANGKETDKQGMYGGHSMLHC